MVKEDGLVCMSRILPWLLATCWVGFTSVIVGWAVLVNPTNTAHFLPLVV